MPNAFDRRRPDSGKLSMSGFRYNIAKNSRWTESQVEGLNNFRSGWDKIYGDKKKTEGEPDGEQAQDG